MKLKAGLSYKSSMHLMFSKALSIEQQNILSSKSIFHISLLIYILSYQHCVFRTLTQKTIILYK